jgi:Family of unknown function (DUF6188)
MDEVLRIFVLGVEWFALWLERSPLHVAWPVLFIFLFQVFLSIVHVFQWYARGMLLRINCDYPITTSKESDPCKNKTLGEWHRCHQHRHRWQRLTDGHVVDPDLPRWQTIGPGGIRMERPDRYGEGMLRARSRKIGLLYHRGYARRPWEVKRLVPELIADYRNRWRELRAQVNPGASRGRACRGIQGRPPQAVVLRRNDARVPAAEDFEAWELVGPDGLRTVSLPGGDLAVWQPDEIERSYQGECKYVDCSGGEVAQVRIPEEALNQVWEPLQPMERGQRLALRSSGLVTRPGRSGRA